ncbi:hypothetical protein GOBAR_DD02768 [Gossypium barbadense]|nr:hypothetical protein GOBAR_DD02768 [Gossypium barbadense]
MSVGRDVNLMICHTLEEVADTTDYFGDRAILPRAGGECTPNKVEFEPSLTTHFRQFVGVYVEAGIKHDLEKSIGQAVNGLPTLISDFAGDLDNVVHPIAGRLFTAWRKPQSGLAQSP